jgi:hypothetical protein
LVFVGLNVNFTIPPEQLDLLNNLDELDFLPALERQIDQLVIDGLDAAILYVLESVFLVADVLERTGVVFDYGEGQLADLVPLFLLQRRV